MHSHPHGEKHPNVHFRSQEWSEEQTLYVVAPYSNPRRWNQRRKLMEDFRRHMSGSANVVLYVGELAYGDRPFEVTDSRHPFDIQFRTRHELWHKENIANLIISRLPADWKYVAMIDADFHFTRHDWALEAVHQLQHYDAVQLYTTYGDLGPDHRPLRILPSFAARFNRRELRPPAREGHGRPMEHCGSHQVAPHIIANACEPAPRRETLTTGVGTTGGAWAYRREAFEAMGGLLDTCILGSGDWHMAFGKIGEPDTHPNVREMTMCGHTYAESIRIWQARAARYFRGNVGVVDCHALHFFHGSKQLRGYDSRWKILRDLDYNPNRDIFRDSQGIYQLSPERPDLREALRDYFASRSEDCISTHREASPPIA